MPVPFPDYYPHISVQNFLLNPQLPQTPTNPCEILFTRPFCTQHHNHCTDHLHSHNHGHSPCHPQRFSGAADATFRYVPSAIKRADRHNPQLVWLNVLNPRITSSASVRSPNHESNVSNRVFILITLCLKSLLCLPLAICFFPAVSSPTTTTTRSSAVTTDKSDDEVYLAASPSARSGRGSLNSRYRSFIFRLREGTWPNV